MNDIAPNRAMLIALLLDMPLGPPQAIEGIADLSTNEKLFSLAACCAEMMAETIWIQSLANRQSALQGLGALVDDIKDNISSRVDGEF